MEELIEKINDINLEDNYYIKIILIGKRNFEIKLNNILKLINNKNILKIKNETEMKYELEEISKENSLRGIFVKQLLAKKDDVQYDKNEIETAIEIGLNAMKTE